MFLRISIILLCCMMLISCSDTEKSTDQEAVEGLLTPTQVNIFIYRSDSIKPQPELIALEDDPKHLNAATIEIQYAKPTTFSTPDKISKSMYFNSYMKKRGKP